MTNNWQGLPYYPISEQYRRLFGEKVYKIPISVAETCPNREGLKGMKTCVFCDEWGSAAYPESRELSVAEQIEQNKKWIVKRIKAKKFLIYLQAYTNTFTKVSRLARTIEESLCADDIVGIVIGTRPDCISDSVFDLWNKTAEVKKVFVEFGVQSFSNSQLRWMERGHSAEKSIWAIQKTREKCPTINLGIHLMFGLPNETDADIVASAEQCNLQPIDNVKLHNLHVLRNTPLADWYAAGSFIPIDRENYARRVSIFLQHLSPDIAVHRLTALSSRHDELIAPAWTSKKMESYQYVLDYMRAHSAFQGQLSSTKPSVSTVKEVTMTAGL